MLSAVIIAWNEEKNLPCVIGSVRELADEIVVVVDSATTDKTAQIAKDLGCRVYPHQHTGIVEPMRNFAISKAKCDWILLLDADEEVSPGLASQIKKIISADSADYCRIPRQNYIFGHWITSSHWWPDYVYRLFKKGSIVWENQIHSLPQTRGTGIDLPPQPAHALIHHAYTSVSQYVDRLNRYTDHQLTDLLNTDYQFNWVDLVNKPFQEFLTQYFARQGYQDGVHGLALSLLQSFSELVLYLKYWQKTGFKSESITPARLSAEINRLEPQYHWWLYQSKIEHGSVIQKYWWKLIRKLTSI